ncbi:MAG: methyltransferase domain-containing protein [Nitrosopumilus sp.]|nr:MAG: methyltransferase domain-containing protein [Nitrosopumilus sp.]QMU55426.1 MAG: methyltransferase domain-containing protein [Nitrosopumilus sp.]
MGFFDTENGVEQYIKMAEGYDGAELIKILQKYLPENSTVLELGIGPGKDVNILKKSYEVTGSDNSQVFLDKYKKNHPNKDLLLLDAVTIQTDRKFDCIYSNKVLHHLTKEDLTKSLQRQNDVLGPNGIAFHSFWKGNKVEEMEGLLFTYYETEDLKKITESNFDVLAMETYAEMEKDDSIYVVLRIR